MTTLPRTARRLVHGVVGGSLLTAAGLVLCGPAAQADTLPLPSGTVPSASLPSVPVVSDLTSGLASALGGGAALPGASAPTLPAAPTLPGPLGSAVSSGPSQLSSGLSSGATALKGALAPVTGALPGASGAGTGSGTSTSGGSSAAGSGATTALPGVPNDLIGACVRLTTKAPPIQASIVLLDRELISTLTKAGVPLQQLVVPCPAGATTPTPAPSSPGSGGAGGSTGTGGKTSANSALPAATRLDASPTAARLPHTGDDVLPWLFYGTVLLVGGGALTVAARRGLVPVPVRKG